jgi:von Willebrand factor type A domain
MWLILLDASGSMSNPFEAAAQFAGRQRSTLAQTKIDVAREALVLHLQGLGEATRVAIFAFRNTAELVYDGPSDDAVQIRTVLDAVDQRDRCRGSIAGSA